MWELSKEHPKESCLDHVWARAWAVSRVQKSRARLWGDEKDRSKACAWALRSAGKSMAETKVQPWALLKGAQSKEKEMAIPKAQVWASTKGRMTV